MYHSFTVPFAEEYTEHLESIYTIHNNPIKIMRILLQKMIANKKGIYMIL